MHFTLLATTAAQLDKWKFEGCTNVNSSSWKCISYFVQIYLIFCGNIPHFLWKYISCFVEIYLMFCGNICQFFHTFLKTFLECQNISQNRGNIPLCLLCWCSASREGKLLNISHQLGSTLDFRQNSNFQFSATSSNCFGKFGIHLKVQKVCFLVKPGLLGRNGFSILKIGPH